MLFNYKGQIHFMDGAERLTEVIDFEKIYNGDIRQELLKFIYYSYKKEGTFALLPPAERKMIVIERFELFDAEKRNSPDYWTVIEEMEGIKSLILCYLYHTYTMDERNLLIFYAKAEKYQKLLMNPSATFEEELEYEKGLNIFRKKYAELEEEILAKQEFEEESSLPYHLFEIPDKYKQDGFLF